MSCIQFGISVPGDVNNRLAKAVDAVAGHDSSQAQVLASYFGTDEFIQFVKQETEHDDVLKVNLNTLKRLLREYFVARHNSISNTINRKNADQLNGFSSAKAKTIAKAHTGNLIIDTYYPEVSKPKGERLDNVGIINSVSKQINKIFNEQVVNNLIGEVRANSDKDGNAIAFLEKIDSINGQINDLFDEYDSVYDAIDIAEDGDVEQFENRLDEIDEELNDLENKRYIIYRNFVEEFGNVRQNNYATLVSQVRGNPNKWYKEVFNTSKLIDLVDNFEITLESEKLLDKNYVDDNDVDNQDSDSVDEMAKSWEDTLYKSFDRHVSPNIKFYFNSLYNLASPTPKGNKNYDFDDNNELGVPMTMGANFVITQISNYANFNSVEDFINSVSKAAQTNPSLYGLSKLVNDMLADRVFANEVFTQLANPKIAKTLVTISENGIEIDQSNKGVDPAGFMIFNFINSAKSTYLENYSEKDKDIIKNLAVRLNKVTDNNVFINSNTIKELDNSIYNILHKYFPKLDKNALYNHLYSDTSNAKEIYKEMLNNLSLLVNNVESIVDNYNEQNAAFMDGTMDENGANTIGYKKWAKMRSIAREANEPFNVPMPVFDYSNIDYSKLNAPIIELVKKLVNYSSIKNELNSTNAEGNMASDLIGNNYITNFIKQLNYSNSDINAGLERLKEFITKSPQYKHSPIFFGVKDKKGKLISPGLFIDTGSKIIVNPDAKSLLNISLFDGAKDRVNSKAAMYSGMSKGDYFLTQLVAFNNPINFVTNNSNVSTAGYFMRTPSDAPKNFIVQAPKQDVNSLWNVLASSRNEYIENYKKELIAKYNITDEGNRIDQSENILVGNVNNKINNNNITGVELYNLLNDEIDNKQYGNLYHFYDNDSNKVSIPLVYQKEDTKIIVWLTGDKVLNTNSNIVENLKIEEIYNPLYSESSPLSDDFIIDVLDVLTADGITSGQIQRTVDKDNGAFRALQANLLGELTNFVHNLNNVFELKKGEWVSKGKVDNLIDRAHYNGDAIVKDGKLTGNFFNFLRLFESNGYSVDSELKTGLFLYGQDNVNGTEALFSSGGKNKLKLNINREDIITTKNGRIELNISEDNLNLLDNIVEQWLNNYYSEIIDKTKQYDTILEDRYTTNDIVDYAINNAIMEMNFDDLFEGDSKFYKNAQDFLKRAKEVQAAGKAYAGFDVNDVIGGPVQDLVDVDGGKYPILINNNIYKLARRGSTGVKEDILYPRNGFHGVTIYNTVRPSKNAGKIKQELVDILSPKLGNKQANEIATEIAKGYFENTKVNDAQSYITLEEFISRRHADGTLGEYQDLINQLMDDNIPIESIDLKGVNSRIQVQKNFYFDKQYDDNTGTYYPRQIKNAEFVLIPKLIKGTDLEQLYNIMKANDINQVNTVEASKAAKKNILTFWDNNGVANPDAFDKSIKANKGIAVESYYYRYLYQQQKVADHIRDEKNKAGIQIMKKIIDNAGQEVSQDIDSFFKSYVANIKEDFNTLLVKMDWNINDGQLKSNNPAVNADGKSILRFDEFYKKARIEAQRLGMDSNFIEYLTPDEFGNPYMPNFMNNVSSKLESIAQSIFNNGVTRQTLPGWHAAQVTSVGHGAEVLGEDGKFRELKYHPQVTSLKKKEMPNYKDWANKYIARFVDTKAVLRNSDIDYYNKQVEELISGNLKFASFAEEDLNNRQYTPFIDTLKNNGFKQVEGMPHIFTKDGVNPKDMYEAEGNEEVIISEAYAEIMLPRWSSLIPKDYDLSKLGEEGLDIHLGYRIPTEGKQSISILKVVGFLDDIYGSTVMVPDEWVTQTGSDFDVDSIYGISYEMYKDRNGNIKKILFDESVETEDVQRRYINYINSTIDKKVDRDLIEDEFLENKYNRLYDELKNLEVRKDDSKEFNRLMKEEAVIYKKLPDTYKDAVKTLNEQLADINIVDKFTAIANSFNVYAEQVEDGELKGLLEDFAAYNDALAYTVGLSSQNYENFITEFKGAKKELTKQLYEDNRLEYFNKVKKVAKEANLMSYEDFAKLPIEEQNNRKARNNKILDSMINIMKHPSSREENYSRSNFDDLTNAMKKMDALRGASSVTRSPYNPLDQVDFMENAMSGATLKAFSVTRDTFNSVNNRTRTILNKEQAIDVQYDLSEYDLNTLKNAYGDNLVVDKSRNVAIIKHNRLANSLNNRNVIGKLITTYSSQTTAHILDAVKEGTIFNENDYTFGTFKTLIDLGIDYETAIAFLMQPGITRVVDSNFETKSIYINSTSNPINAAIKKIAIDLGITIGGRPINEYTSIGYVLNKLSTNGNIQLAYSELFGANVDNRNTIGIHKVVLDKTMLQNRLKQANLSNNSKLLDIDKKFVDAAFDLAMIINFNKYRDTTLNIESLARVSNPDRFGAKQTIRSTRRTLENIVEYSFNKDNPVTNSLLVDGKPLLQSLYPDMKIQDGRIVDLDINKSKYPYLAAFLKYATIPSVEANSQLFPTEGDQFNYLTSAVEDKLNITFTDAQYKEFKQYIISNVYNNVEFLNSPLTVNKFGLITFDAETIKEYAENDNKYWDAEKARVFGYDITQSSSLQIEDINNPTEEDIAKFNRLTPAQKVIWIQSNFNDNAGVFDFLDVNTFNQYEYKAKGFSSQSIKYSDQIDDIEQIYVAFRDSFFNKNPLIRLASVDLVKYAFAVEGFKFKKGSISKIITNDALYSNIEDRGFNVIHAIQQQFASYTNIKESSTTKAIDRFIRSHSEIVKEVNIPKAKKDKQGNENIGYKYARTIKGEGISFIPFNDANSDLLEHLTINDFSPRNYIRLSKTLASGKRSTTLYKIVPNNIGVYLYPLNLLERNETSDYSAINKNNIYRTPEFYEAIIAKSEDSGLEINQLLKDDKGLEEIKILRERFTITPHKVKHVVETVENSNELIRISNNGTQMEQAQVNKFIADINDYFNLPVEEMHGYGVIRNDNRYISSLIPKGSFIVQNIPFGEDNIKVKISKYDKAKGRSAQFNMVLRNEPKANIEKVKPEELNALRNSIDAKSVNPNLYKIELVTEQAVKEDYENTTRELEEYNATHRDAITNIIEDIDVDVVYEFTDADKVSKDMFNELYRRSISNDDKGAVTFKTAMDVAGIDRTSAVSIHNNKKNIYVSAAQYYADKSISLLNSINEFVGINGEKFSIDDPALYKHLTDYPEDYPLLVKLILDAKTFGEQFYDIFNLNLTGEDAATTRAIEKIRNAINNVRTNSKLRKGVDLIFNDYIANNFSTNPLVRQGLIELKTSFGDTDWFDLNLSDVGEVNNKQIQTIVKYVNAILNEATKIVAPKSVNKFNTEYNKIMSKEGPFEWDNFITKQGKFISQYSDKFLEDREKVVNDVRDAEENFGIDSMEYAKAKLARDKWRAKNVHQEVISSYYDNNNELVSRVLKNAPKEYLEYMKLTRELYKDSKGVGLLTKDERERRKEITSKIRQLTSEFDESGELKSDEKRFRASELSKYIDGKKLLNSEYFNYDETDGFKTTLEYYTNIIKRYEKDNPLESLEQRLENPDYKDAYDWVHSNTIYKLDDAAQEKVFKAFKTLQVADSNNASKVKNIIAKADAYDDYGRIDPRKLSDEDRAALRKLAEHKYSWTYDSNAGEAILIKEVPTGLPVLKDSFYRMLRGDSENDSGVNKERLRIIGEINKLLSIAVDKNTGQINSKDLFEKLTEEQLDNLVSLYGTLHTIKGDRKPKELRDKFKNNVEFKTNDAAFNRELAYAETHLKSTKQYRIWKNIFVQRDKDGNYMTEGENYIPNNDLFGYIVPKDKTYIDVEKTEARKLVENDLEFVPTEYYFEAIREESAKGTYNEWFQKNHVYNPYTHKMEPLKVWTTMRVNPNGNLKGTYSYVPTYDNTERTVKDEFVNHDYKRYSTNYNIDTGSYNNLTKLSEKERDMFDLLQSTVNAHASTHSMKVFADKGFLPRRAKYTPDARWYAGQALGTLGLEFRNTGEKQWTDSVNYTKDFDADFDMMSLIKRKGYKERIKIDPKGTRETEEEYAARVEEIRAQNKKIDEDNLALDNEVLDRDWQSVFNDFIDKATEYNAKQRVKNTVYLLLEDLKDSTAYKTSSWSGNLKKDNSRSTTEIDQYQTIPQENSYKLVENWARRILFSQFKKASPYSKWADLAQNITSAKYMIFNVTGGIANIGTGLTNVMGERFASDYFGGADFRKAQARYFSNSLTFLADREKDKTNNLSVAITKMFDVVDYDAFTERRPNETATENVRRIRNALYGMQSMGEHYMQNSVLFAMLASHRIYKDTDGQLRVGSISNYNWEIETQTLMSMLQSDEDMLTRYKSFLKSIKNDLNELRKYDTFSRDFNEDFLRDVGDKKLIKEYIAKRKEAIKNAKSEFNKLPLVEDQFELVDGQAVIKEDSLLTSIMFGELRQKVISVNKKIHGVYDKIGAASIEKEWWGGLVMQYHKHIYPGIMKRYRRKGYYNESRNSIEKGSYVSFVDLLATEFKDIKRKVNERQDVDNENVAIASIREVVKASVDTVLNLKLNYQMLPTWEQNNIKRVLGDLLGVTSAFMMAMAVHLMTDDDEIKESELLSTVLYMADRLNSESAMYTPWGLYAEAGTLWSSPIAAQNGPKDLIKGLGIGVSILFDAEYNPYYTTGLYKGEHKAAVLLYRNTPIYRVYQRLSNMTRNNNYYRINENALNIKYAKTIADNINPD